MSDKMPPSGVRVFAPESDLYVYLLNGAFPGTEEPLLGDTFVGNWVEGNTSFLFFSGPCDRMLPSILSRLRLELVDRFRFKYKDWQGGAGDPLQIGSFMIFPPWKEVSIPGGLMPLRLDPGVVFGNGLHPTTRDCILALLYARERGTFGRVLDLGTGTGILAVASALLGAGKVVAIDLNPLCVRTAFRNVVLNGLQGTIDVREGYAEEFVDEPCDLAVANIHHEVIARLIESEGFGACRRWIISGLLRSQWREVRHRLEGGGIEVLREWDHEMTWFTVLAEKR